MKIRTSLEIMNRVEAAIQSFPDGAALETIADKTRLTCACVRNALDDLRFAERIYSTYEKRRSPNGSSLRNVYHETRTRKKREILWRVYKVIKENKKPQSIFEITRESGFNLSQTKSAVKTLVERDVVDFKRVPLESNPELDQARYFWTCVEWCETVPPEISE